MKNGTTLQTVSRAVQVLRTFEGGSLDLSLKELTDRIGLNKVTVLRLAQTLVKEGLLVHDSRVGLYRISFGCIRLASKLLELEGLFDFALPFMEEARKKTNETVCLLVREDGDRVATHTLPSFQLVRFVLEIGDRRPVHLGASGQCLISRLSDNELEILLSHREGQTDLQKYDVTGSDIRERLKQVRAKGWAVARGEWSDEAAGAAAPIISHDGTINGAISIVVPVSRASDEYMENCAMIAKEAAKQTSTELSKQHQ